MTRRGPPPVLSLKLQQLLLQDPNLSTKDLALLLAADVNTIRALRSRIKRNGFRNGFCPSCGKGTFVDTEDGRFCTSCGLVGDKVEVMQARVDVRDAVDPRSHDNGLGTEALQTIRNLRYRSRLLKNTWQVVLGNYNHGLRDTFVESCLRDLDEILDGATAEQMNQCRNLTLRTLRDLSSYEELLKSRRKAKRLALRRTIQEAVRAWPRLGNLPRVQAFLSGETHDPR